MTFLSSIGWIFVFKIQQNVLYTVQCTVHSINIQYSVYNSLIAGIVGPRSELQPMVMVVTPPPNQHYPSTTTTPPSTHTPPPPPSPSTVPEIPGVKYGGGGGVASPIICIYGDRLLAFTLTHTHTHGCSQYWRVKDIGG